MMKVRSMKLFPDIVLSSVTNSHQYEKEIEQCYIQYNNSMLRRAKKLLADEHEAEDLANECWMALAQHWDTIHTLDDKARSTYIMNSLYRKATDYIRKKGKNVTVLVNDIDEYSSQLLSPTDKEDLICDKIIQVTNHLTEREKNIFIMKLQGIGDDKIAKKMGIKISSVRVYWYRIKKKCKQ